MFKYSKDDETSYCLGTTLAIELFKTSPNLAKRLYISPKQKRDETYQKLVDMASKYNVPLIENNERIFKDLSGKDNVMVIAEFRKEERKLDEKHNHVVLVNPSNMGNLGTIIRSMAAFSYLDLAIIKPASDVFDPKVLRSSMGAFFHLSISTYSSFEDYHKEFPNHRYYPFMLQAKTTLEDAHKEKPCSLVFGNEATGLDKSYLDLGEALIIPNSAFVDSLNLDNAVSIALYEFRKLND